MFYSIRHITRYRYDAPVRESVMQLYMQPKSEGAQRLQSFQVSTNPRAGLQAYTDHFGNAVYHFDVPGTHQELQVEADAEVEVQAMPAPPEWVDASAWAVLETAAVKGEHFDMLVGHGIAQATPALRAFLDERALTKTSDPMTTLRRLNRAVFDGFDYAPEATEVDSSIDVALGKRKGVCQDFAHIMIATARAWGIPARYVSGYLFTKREAGDRSASDATHAWVEAFIPGCGWVGFDPTNNVLAGERHIRVAIGRDYSDVPPSRGVFKGPANSELAVAVRVTPAQVPRRRDDFLRVVRPMAKGALPPDMDAIDAQQQQ
ncbi:MAG: transglutaminase family protein [Alphaproteobacteria bacterium]|nr:transglutaminase family protein [Alphaproteobacteria bacterium]